jgi:hypothetical protein
MVNAVAAGGGLLLGGAFYLSGRLEQLNTGLMRGSLGLTVQGEPLWYRQVRAALG